MLDVFDLGRALARREKDLGKHHKARQAMPVGVQSSLCSSPDSARSLGHRMSENVGPPQELGHAGANSGLGMAVMTAIEHVEGCIGEKSKTLPLP